MISILMLQKESFESVWEVVSICFAVLSLICLILSLGYYAKLINVYLEESEIAGDRKESPLHSLFSVYRLKKEALRYPIVFFLRRYALILVLTLLSQFKMMQIACQFLTTTLMIIYLVEARPHEERFARF